VAKVSGLPIHNYYYTQRVDALEAHNRCASSEHQEHEQFLHLLPDVEATLITLTRPSKFSIKKLVPYWLDTPSLTFARKLKISV
jgi:hypothetical protein